MSDEIYQGYRLLRGHRSKKKRARRIKAESDYLEACRIAEDHGFLLKKYSQQHYGLMRPDGPFWRVDFYPGNCRVYRDPHSTNRRLELQFYQEWNLITFVEAAVRSMKEESGDE